MVDQDVRRHWRQRYTSRWERRKLWPSALTKGPHDWTYRERLDPRTVVQVACQGGAHPPQRVQGARVGKSPVRSWQYAAPHRLQRQDHRDKHLPASSCASPDSKTLFSTLRPDPSRNCPTRVRLPDHVQHGTVLQLPAAQSEAAGASRLQVDVGRKHAAQGNEAEKQEDGPPSLLQFLTTGGAESYTTLPLAPAGPPGGDSTS